MVRVLAVADEEVPGALARVRDLRVDLLVSVGDLAWDYLEPIVAALGVPAAYVPGNHDQVFPAGTAPRGMVNVDDRVAELGGLRIAGLGGCVRYNNGHHQYTQKEYDKRGDRLSRKSRSLGRAVRNSMACMAFSLGMGVAGDNEPLETVA